MSTLWMVVATAFLFGLFALFVYWLLSLLFGGHSEQFRDPITGRRLGESPHLEMRGEYELTHPTGSPHLED